MNKKFLLCIIASLALCASACTESKSHHNDDPHSTACEELGISKSLNKIINGVTCDKSKSAIVELDITNEYNNEGLCTGTIINSNTVLTAAHCFEEGAIAVAIKAGGKTYDAVQAIIHPLYDKNPSPARNYDRNDVALVKIAGTFSIAPLPIITSRSVKNGETLIVAGYGEDENKDYGTLKAAYMKASETYKSGFVLAYDDTHTNVCFGDSGGPAFGYVDGVLGVFGVTSSGTVGDCLSGDKTFFPGLYFSENTSFILANASVKQL